MTSPADAVRDWALILSEGTTPLEIGAPAGSIVTIGYIGPKFALEYLTIARQGDVVGRKQSQWPRLSYTARADEVAPDLTWIDIVMPDVVSLAWLARRPHGSHVGRSPVLLRQDKTRAFPSRQVDTARTHALGASRITRVTAKRISEKYHGRGVQGTRLAMHLVQTCGEEALATLDQLKRLGRQLGQVLPGSLADIAALQGAERDKVFSAAEYFLKEQITP